MKYFKITVIGALIILAGICVVLSLAYPIILMYKSDPQSANIYVAVGTLLLALATVALACLTYYSVKSGYEREKRDRKERLLNEIIEWVFSIEDITLEPITEDKLTFRQFNIELKYGKPMNRVQLLEMEIEKILKDQDLKEKVSKVAELLVAVMVLDIARHENGDINESVIEAFPGYVNFVGEIRSEIDDEANKTGKSKKDAAYDMWKKYVVESSNAEAGVLGKIVSLKADLLKP